MVSLRRELVYSLLVAIALLIAGLVALLRVSNTREERYQDELTDLHRSLLIRDAEIRQLRRQIERLTPAADSSWTNWPADSFSASH